MEKEMGAQTDSRYPYTHACDYLRAFGGMDKGGVRLSRSDASQIRQAVAVAIGMSDEDLAKKLADYYQANEEALTQQSSDKLLKALGFTQAISAAGAA